MGVVLTFFLIPFYTKKLYKNVLCTSHTYNEKVVQNKIVNDFKLKVCLRKNCSHMVTISHLVTGEKAAQIIYVLYLLQNISSNLKILMLLNLQLFILQLITLYNNNNKCPLVKNMCFLYLSENSESVIIIFLSCTIVPKICDLVHALNLMCINEITFRATE